RRFTISTIVIVSHVNAVPAAHPSVISTFALHDALPICDFIFADAFCENFASPVFSASSITSISGWRFAATLKPSLDFSVAANLQDRKSTRLNSSHVSSSYAVFCLKKKIYVTTDGQ